MGYIEFDDNSFLGRGSTDYPVETRVVFYNDLASLVNDKTDEELGDAIRNGHIFYRIEKFDDGGIVLSPITLTIVVSD